MLRLQRPVSHLGEYIAYSIVKHIYLLFNKLIFNTHTALAMPGTLCKYSVIIITLTRTLSLRSYLNHHFFFCLSHRKVPGIQQALNKHFFINVTTEMYLKHFESFRALTKLLAWDRQRNQRDLGRWLRAWWTAGQVCKSASSPILAMGPWTKSWRRAWQPTPVILA